MGGGNNKKDFSTLLFSSHLTSSQTIFLETQHVLSALLLD